FNLGRSPTYTVTVTAPTYASIEATAGVRVTGENLKLAEVKVDTSAGVAATLSGECTVLNAKAAAGASINAQDLKCQSATLNAAAGAKIEANIPGKVDAKAAAGAAIDITGNPTEISQQVDFGGAINVH